MEGYSKKEILKSNLKYSKVGRKVSEIKGRFENLLPGSYKQFFKPSLPKRLLLKKKKPGERYVVEQTSGREFKVGETVRLEPDILSYRVSVYTHSVNLGFQYTGVVKDTSLCDLLYVKGAMYGVIEAVSKNSQVAWISRITR